LGHDTLDVVPISTRLHLSYFVRLLAFQLSKHRMTPQGDLPSMRGGLEATLNHLRVLYELIMAPLRGGLKAKHLVIAPCSVLQDVPFHALYDGSRHVIDDFTVSYAHSASLYALCQSRRVHKVEKSLILGLPDDLAPHVQEEVIAIANLLPAPRLFLGQSATAQCFHSEGPESRFIHVASHGHFRRESPLFSGIKLASSYLSLYDLYRLTLPAELITFNGCSTGRNVVARGGEALGLARGLICAGAETALLTMWDVQDRSAARWMCVFYKHLVAGQKKSDALQKAMQEVRSEYPHPAYWSPFVLIGKE
jgi:CHAT domain-containing protein